MKKASIFLTVAEAIRAICMDFKQYDPQIMLFGEVLRLISDDAMYLKRDPYRNGAWSNQRGRTSMRWLSGPDLIAFMCQAVVEAEWNPKLLADVCGRVFQTRAAPATDLHSGEAGVDVATNMETFACRQCGNCCRCLDYRYELTDEDVARWKALACHDILQWVEVNCEDEASRKYRIWVSPKSRRMAPRCPFLTPDPTSDRWHCSIHTVKPGICRQYPISRKHAIMTGCRGFAPPGPPKR